MELKGKELKYYNTADILDFLGIKYDFKNSKEYPFCDGIEKVKFNYPYITIPRTNIEKIIQKKISDEDYRELLDKIKMLVHLPFYNTRTENTGVIIVNVTVGFRYDKEYKYGDVNRSLPEMCYAIERMGKKTNDFYIIDKENVHEFMSYYVCCTQWGIGADKIISSPQVNINKNFTQVYDWEN